ncbi:MAG TPA: hypothetical protein VMU98_05885 [Acidimicrobiales bacterium]|nr:hypothetical protein [Acidimicrobiales bacterium]
MFHRIPTWWRALVVAFLSLATLTWPTSVSAAGPANFRVIHQSVVTKLPHHGAGVISVSLQLVDTSSKSARLTLSLFPALTQRGALQNIVSGAGDLAAPVSTTTVDLGCVKRGVAAFSLTLYTRRAVAPSGTCAATRPELHLACSSSACDGVYPLRYEVRVGGVTRTKWSLVAVQQSFVAQPLRVALVSTLEPGSALHPRRATSVLRAFAHDTNAPFALATDYRLLSVLSESPADDPLRSAFIAALASPQHVALNAPPATIDISGLVANGFSTQVGEQLNLTDNLLQSVTGRYSAGPVVLSGSPTTASTLALSRAGATNVILPESDLAVAASQTLTWGAPFQLPGVAGVTALATDGPLSALSSDAAIEPGRRAALTLATLAFLHFEAPNAPSARTVVVMVPAGSTSPVYVAALLQGLANNPFARLSSLPPLFTSSLIATNGAPATRALAAQPVPPNWSSRNVAALTTLIGDVNSYAPAVSSSLVRTQLHVAVARAEIVGSSSQRSNALAAADSLFAQQLQNFSIDPSSITLAGPGTALPITVISHAGYAVNGIVHLVTDRLSFPKGNSVAVAMNSPTNTVRVPTVSSRGSSLTLQVLLTTPNDQVVLARAAIQVRIAGTSVVGYLLTAASVIVLGLWWYRTSRRRSKGRHAR